MGTYLPSNGILGWVVWSGTGIPCSWGIPPNFYPPSLKVGPPFLHLSVPLCIFTHLHLYSFPPLHASLWVSTSLTFLHIWMNVPSLNRWLLDFHTAWFYDESEWYLFCSIVVIFAAVVQGEKACSPMLPSWPEVPVVELGQRGWIIFV